MSSVPKGRLAGTLQSDPRSQALDDRFQAALSYLWTFTSEWQQPGRQPPPGGTRWLSEAIANIREGLLPYLAAPRFLARAPASKRSFPTLLELEAMPHGTLE